MDFARRFVNSDTEWHNRSLAQLSLQYSYSDLYAATDGFHEKNKIGSGSYGQIFKGLINDGTEVAIKVIDLPAEAGFEDEVRVLSKFRHPNLVILMGFAVNGSQRLLVYEYLAGGDVSRRLQRCARDGTPFTYQQRISAALDAACGLSHLHNASPKVFHRDIKTANILLDRNGGAKMADFGLACLSRNTEHKVKQASGTIGYACPYYIQRGVVTEGSEVYSFGMVIIELLCNAPPACAGPNPGEILYLVNHLQGSVSRCVGMADPRAGWPPSAATKLAELAMSCVSMNEQTRPKFVQIVKQLRVMLEQALMAATTNAVAQSSGLAGQQPSSPSSVPQSAALPVSPKRQQVELIKLECVSPVSGKSIIHSCTADEVSNALSGSLPCLKVGRHCQAALFDQLVPTDMLKGTISREHFVISFQPVTRTSERQYHATLTNNSINSISVNGTVLERGQSSFIYQGDLISFLALQHGTSQLMSNNSSHQVPTPFITFRVEISSNQPLVQANRPKQQPIPSGGGSAQSLPVGAHNSSYLESSVNSGNDSSIDGNFVTENEDPSLPFYLIVIPGGDVLGCKDVSGTLRVGRSYQPESFWRQVAPEACAAISREHFTIKCENRTASPKKQHSSNQYRFYLTCNSMNGLGVMVNPNNGPVFIQKDTPGSIEIFDGTEIELAGTIQLVFRENLNSGGMSNHLTTAKPQPQPQASVLPAKSPHFTSSVASTSANSRGIVAATHEEFPEDSFARTGFRGGVQFD